MRERLIELLKQVDKKCDNSIECKDCAGYGKGMWCKEYLTADHLLANGVIVPMYEQSMEETLKDIVQYNGHAEWLTELVKQIEESKKEEEYFSCPLPTKQWHTEEHAIWMFLVGMFGDWVQASGAVG